MAMKNYARRLLKGDSALFFVIVILMLISLLVIFSSTGRLAYNEREGNTWYYFLRHLILCAGGLVILWGMRYFSWRKLYQNAGWLLLISAGLVMVASFGGQNINDAGRWIVIPVIGLTFQPSEFAKIAIVIYVARLLSDFQTDKGCDSQVIKFLWPPLGVMALVFWDNFSTSALMAGVCLLMCLIGRIRWQLLAKFAGLGVTFLCLLVVLGMTFPALKEAGRVGTIISRLTTFVERDNETDEGKDSNFQSNQAHIAVARGGMTGCGPGNSEQRNILPHPYSDFIYAIIIEEYGLMGGVAVFLLYTIILFRAGVIARKILKVERLNPRGGPDIFPALLVVGLSVSIVLQAIFHMGVNVGAFPVTGQTLPLVSMGGTSVWFIAAAFGIILNTAYSFSQEGLAEEVEKTRTKKMSSRPKSDIVDEEMIDDYDGGELFGKELEQNERGKTTKQRECPEDGGVKDLPEFEDELESDGREVLKELRKRNRRRGNNLDMML